MTNELTAALTWVAEGAGVELAEDHSLIGSPWYWRNKPHELKQRFKAMKNGTLSLEDVGLVCSWLTKGGFQWAGGRHKDSTDEFFEISDPDLIIGNPDNIWHKVADSLEAALASAVVALHKASKGEKRDE